MIDRATIEKIRLRRPQTLLMWSLNLSRSGRLASTIKVCVLSTMKRHLHLLCHHPRATATVSPAEKEVTP